MDHQENLGCVTNSHYSSDRFGSIWYVKWFSLWTCWMCLDYDLLSGHFPGLATRHRRRGWLLCHQTRPRQLSQPAAARACASSRHWGGSGENRCPGVGTSSCGPEDQGPSIKRRIVNGWPMQPPSWGCCWMKLEMSPLKPQKKCVLKMICPCHWRKMKIRVLETPLRDSTLRYESLRRSLEWLAWECWSWIDNPWSSQKRQCLRSDLPSPMVIFWRSCTKVKVWCCHGLSVSFVFHVHQEHLSACRWSCSVWSTSGVCPKMSVT